jgi:hypothetical protein
MNDDPTITLVAGKAPKAAPPRAWGQTLDKLKTADLPVRFGRYVLRSVLREGGIACVFRAELRGAADFQKLVVLKGIKNEATEPLATAGESERSKPFSKLKRELANA